MKKKSVLLLAVLVLVIAGAALAYPKLSETYKNRKTEAPAPTEQSGEETEQLSSRETESPTASSQEAPENPAPDFTVLDREGRQVKLSDLRGKPTVVNFWATWCMPCLGELPDFQEAWLEYGDRVNFLFVDLTDGGRDTVEKVKDFVRKQGYDFPLFFDTTGEAAEAYGLMYIPMSLFIDARGGLVYEQVGAMEAEALEMQLQKLLQ